MKYLFIIALLFSAVLLTGCAALQEEISIPDDLTEAFTTASVTTAATTTKVTTTTALTTTVVTTTKKVDPPADLVMNCLGTVEAGAEITLDYFITERNVELKDGSALLNTSGLGYFNAEVPYLYDGAEFTQTLQYFVADTTEPLIINPGRECYHKVETEFDLNQYIGFADNFDKYPSLTYEGEIDPDTVGSYLLNVTVTDSSGNFSAWDVVINVVEEVPKSVDTNPRVNYSDFISRYDGEDVRFGIDVSAWQGDIDYKAVRDAGCSFVIMRAGYYYSKLIPDDYFSKNLKNAAAAGLDIGVYFYTTDRTEEGVREHVRWIAEQLDGQKLDLPIAFDWEEFAHFQQYGISIRDLNDVYAAFADEVRKQGYQPMLYSSKIFLDTVWSERSKAAAPVWLAHYVDETTYTGEYAIWQESAYGRIPGIDGDVDMDIQYLKQKID